MPNGVTITWLRKVEHIHPDMLKWLQSRLGDHRHVTLYEAYAEMCWMTRGDSSRTIEPIRRARLVGLSRYGCSHCEGHIRFDLELIECGLSVALRPSEDTKDYLVFYKDTSVSYKDAPGRGGQ